MKKVMFAFLFGMTFAVQSAIYCPKVKKIHFYKGDRVLFKSDETGDVLEVFSNGKASVQRDNYATSEIIEVSKLAKSIFCFDNFHAKDRVLFKSDETGDVLEVFSNGKASVHRDNYAGNEIIEIFKLVGY